MAIPDAENSAWPNDLSLIDDLIDESLQACDVEHADEKQAVHYAFCLSCKEQWPHRENDQFS